jgi:hypothetical protein
MNWTLQIALHYPHDRFALGWDFIDRDEENDYRTINVYLFIATFTLDF